MCSFLGFKNQLLGIKGKIRLNGTPEKDLMGVWLKAQNAEQTATVSQGRLKK